jgi:hypothetical protein
MKLHQQLNNYINRAFMLHRVGKPEYYNTARRLAALDRLRTVQMITPGMSQRSFCLLVIRHENDLLTVLPFPSNKSYNKTRERIESMLTQCKSEIIFSHENTGV